MADVIDRRDNVSKDCKDERIDTDTKSKLAKKCMDEFRIIPYKEGRHANDGIGDKNSISGIMKFGDAVWMKLDTK